MKRASPLLLLLLPILLLPLLLPRHSSAAMEVAFELPCRTKTGGCLPEQEMEMSSEDSRRLLWAVSGKKYISYEALKGDVVPCSKPGVPYYNCHTFPRASPYSRGCQIISGCRGDSP